MDGEHGDVGGFGENVLQIHLGGVRLGQHGDLVADVGGGEAGIVHRAADGLDGGAVIIHVGIFRDLADDEGFKLAHLLFSFRISASAARISGNSGHQSWNCIVSIICL